MLTLRPRAHHIVRFWTHDDDLIPALADFVADGVRLGERVALLMTRAHWLAVEQQLIAGRVRIGTALKHREVVVLDAEDVLQQISEGDHIDIGRFQQTLAPVMASLHPPLRAFSELVSLIAALGHLDVAIEMEKLGQTLSSEAGVNLLCAYHLHHIDPDGDDVQRLSSHHDAAIADGLADVAPIVLIADEFAGDLKVYEEYLRGQGYQIVCARDGLSAITLARMARPAIALLDIHMAGMSGLEAMRILKKDSLFRTVPFVALTTRGREQERHAYLAEGFDEVIEKPCLPSDVAQVIARLVAFGSGA
jgi:CheY-like chemotaxis protein